MKRGTEELRKEANSLHVAGLNVTENQQDSQTEKTAVGIWSQRVRKVIRVRARNSVHVGLKVTENKQERRQRKCTRGLGKVRNDDSRRERMTLLELDSIALSTGSSYGR